MQYFPSSYVLLLSLAVSQPSVFGLMTIITDELTFPEPADTRPLFSRSLHGIMVNGRMAAFILEPAQLKDRA